MTVEEVLTAIAVLGILGGLVVWGLKRYQALAADGHISVGEVLDAIEDAKEKVEDAKEEIDEALNKE